MKILKIALLGVLFATKTVSASSQELNGIFEIKPTEKFSVVSKCSPTFYSFMQHAPKMTAHKIFQFLAPQTPGEISRFLQTSKQASSLLTEKKLLAPFNPLLSPSSRIEAALSAATLPHISFTPKFMRFFVDHASDEQQLTFFQNLCPSIMTGDASFEELKFFVNSIPDNHETDAQKFLNILMLETEASASFTRSDAKHGHRLLRFADKIMWIGGPNAPAAAARLIQETIEDKNSTIYQKVLAIVALGSLGELYNHQAQEIARSFQKIDSSLIRATEHLSKHLKENNPNHAAIDWGVRAKLDDKLFAIRAFIGQATQLREAMPIFQILQALTHNAEIHARLIATFPQEVAYEGGNMDDFLFGKLVLSMLGDDQKEAALNSMREVSQSIEQSPYNIIRASALLGQLHYFHGDHTAASYMQVYFPLENILWDQRIDAKFRMNAYVALADTLINIKDVNFRRQIEKQIGNLTKALTQGFEISEAERRKALQHFRTAHSKK